MDSLIILQGMYIILTYKYVFLHLYEMYSYYVINVIYIICFFVFVWSFVAQKQRISWCATLNFHLLAIFNVFEEIINICLMPFETNRNQQDYSPSPHNHSALSGNN